MRFFELVGVPFGGKAAVLAPGYYVLAGNGPAPFPIPTPVFFEQTTTKLNDIGASDHATFEEIARPEADQVNYIHALYIHAAPVTLASYSASAFYGVGAIVTAHYWSDVNWQPWAPPGWGLNPGASAWFDLTRNPSDQVSPMVLLTAEVTGDGVDMTTTKFADFRVVVA